MSVPTLREPWTHSVKMLRLVRRRRSSGAEPLKSDGTLWKRPWCLERLWRHEVNANQVFYLRKLYHEGRLGISIATALLPVKVKTERPSKTLPEDSPMLSPGTMEIRFSRGTLRIAGSVDVMALRTVLECLAG